MYLQIVNPVTVARILLTNTDLANMEYFVNIYI